VCVRARARARACVLAFFILTFSMPHYKVILHALGLNKYNMVTYNIVCVCACVRGVCVCWVCVCVCVWGVCVFLFIYLLSMLHHPEVTLHAIM
jgi:hypothetical protein